MRHVGDFMDELSKASQTPKDDYDDLTGLLNLNGILRCVNES